MIVQLLIRGENFVEDVLGGIEACDLNKTKHEITHDNTVMKVDGPAYEIAVILLEMTNWIDVDTVVL